MHYVDAADEFANAITNELEGQIRPLAALTSVQSVADMLTEFHEGYQQGKIPDLRDTFKRDMFNTLRSCMYPGMFPFKLTRHSDPRGSFFECIRMESGGQVSFSTTVPGITRGNHFHFRKVERFLVLSGNARISIRRLGFEQPQHFDVTGDLPCFIDMPTFHTHNITNTGSGELLTLFWTNEYFDPLFPDTYPEAV